MIVEVTISQMLSFVGLRKYASLSVAQDTEPSELLGVLTVVYQH